jgi:hypothetical protein
LHDQAIDKPRSKADPETSVLKLAGERTTLTYPLKENILTVGANPVVLIRNHIVGREGTATFCTTLYHLPAV